MRKELELWNFVAERLGRGERAVLLTVADSKGSSPGRAGYKMAVGEDGDLVGSIGGGVMEVNLVDQARQRLSALREVGGSSPRPTLIKQQHRKNSESPSGMICSGEQTVILAVLDQTHAQSVETILGDLNAGDGSWMSITDEGFMAYPGRSESQNRPLPQFELRDGLFHFVDLIGRRYTLYIIGGGHCALALSELMSRLDFSIRIIDDRPELNTIEKNAFADEVTIVADYNDAARHVPGGENIYLVVMTLGYKSDAVVIRGLVDRSVRYFGVLGSKAKMATLMRELEAEGVDRSKLDRIHTPIGIPINSRTPEEIAISIAAEIISVKNS